MINIFLCCNGRPLAPCSLDLDLDTALVSFELMAALYEPSVIVDKQAGRKWSLFPFVYNVFMLVMIFSCDQLELIKAEETYFIFSMNKPALWLQKLHQSILLWDSKIVISLSFAYFWQFVQVFIVTRAVSVQFQIR